MKDFYVAIYFGVCGYCIGRQLINLYKAMVDLRKFRRERENAYMNLINSIDQDSIA